MYAGWAASRALAGLVGVCAQFLCGRDALDGCNKRKDALVSFALGCLRGVVTEESVSAEYLWAQLQTLRPAWLSLNLGFHLLVLRQAKEQSSRATSVDQVRIKTVLGLVQALTDNVDDAPPAPASSSPPDSDSRAGPSPRDPIQ